MPVAVLTESPRRFVRSRTETRIRHSLSISLLTAAAILIHGYHPYVVDASIYVSGIQKQIDPSLFLRDSAFVVRHAHYSLFSCFMAGLQRASGIPLEPLMLIIYATLVASFLLLAYLTGKHIFPTDAGATEAAGWGAALLMAACLPIPVAATSLLLIDPYLTARSFSTPLTLLAIFSCIEGRQRLALGSCLATALFHPLMSGYLAAFLLIYFLVSGRRWRAVGATIAAAFAVSAAISLLTRSTPVSPSYREAVLSRAYYFPSTWHWYEIAGLLAPLALMGWTGIRAGLSTTLGRLAATSFLTGAASCMCCYCFVHTAGPYLLARLQLLRSFHMIYALGIVMLGGSVAERLGSRFRGLGLAALAVIATAMLLVQRQAYAALPDVELPGQAMRSSYEQGFLWIRDHTPPDAFFAMDPRLFDYEDEAAPGFRAITRRSILTDVKDEGLASLFPALAPVWDNNRRCEQLLQAAENGHPSPQLRQLGVTWVLLPQAVITTLDCPYRNDLLKVCQLPPR